MPPTVQSSPRITAKAILALNSVEYCMRFLLMIMSL